MSVSSFGPQKTAQIALHGVDNRTQLEVYQDSVSGVLLEAAHDGELTSAMLDELLSKGACVDYINPMDQGCSPLYEAVIMGHVEIVKLLIAKGANAGVRTPEGYTLLHAAGFEGLDDVLEILLRDSNIRNSLHIDTKDLRGYTPLMATCWTGQLTCARLLIENNANVDVRHNEFGCALHLCAINGHTEVTELLLKSGAEPNYQNIKGISPLYWASRNGHSDCAQLLLDYKADVVSADKIGNTSLHIAAMSNNTNIVKMLLLAKANIHARDMSGSTPLAKAACGKAAEACQFLVSHGADVNGLDCQGMPALQKAVDSCHLLKCGNSMVIDVLVKAGANVNLASEAGTPLHSAAWNGFSECVDTLIEAGADVNSVVEGKDAPLHFAASRGHAVSVQSLLDNKANINAQNEYGYTPLMRASMLGSDECVDVLIKAGADVTLLDMDGNTALHLSLKITLHSAASKDSALAVVRLLSEANSLVVDKWGDTALFSHVSAGPRCNGIEGGRVIDLLLHTFDVPDKYGTTIMRAFLARKTDSHQLGCHECAPHIIQLLNQTNKRTLRRLANSSTPTSPAPNKMRKTK